MIPRVWENSEVVMKFTQMIDPISSQNLSNANTSVPIPTPKPEAHQTAPEACRVTLLYLAVLTYKWPEKYIVGPPFES